MLPDAVRSAYRIPCTDSPRAVCDCPFPADARFPFASTSGSLTSLRSRPKQYEQYKDVSKKISQAKKYADKDIIKDPALVKNGLKSLRGFTKAEELLNGFDAISIGTSFPFYSRLSLSSLPVNGVHLEWNPGKLYLSATYGKSARQTFNTDFTTPQLTLAQNTLAAKVGYGAPQSTHLYLTYVNISDRFNERSLGSNTKPESNKIIGTEVQLSILGDKIKVGGELMASLLSRDNTIVTEGAQDFVLPGGGGVSANLHLARTVCRRAERLTVALARVDDINPTCVRYLNRLSDALFVFGRHAAVTSGHGEVLWSPEST